MTSARLEIKNASKQQTSMILLDTDHISVLQWEGEAAERLRRRMADSREDNKHSECDCRQGMNTHHHYFHFVFGRTIFYHLNLLVKDLR